MHKWRIIFTDGSSREVEADYMHQDRPLFGTPGDYSWHVGQSSGYIEMPGTEVLRVVRENVQTIEPMDKEDKQRPEPPPPSPKPARRTRGFGY